MQQEYKKGRGAQMNTGNRFEREERTREHMEAVDEWVEGNVTKTGGGSIPCIYEEVWFGAQEDGA